MWNQACVTHKQAHSGAGDLAGCGCARVYLVFCVYGDEILRNMYMQYD